MSEKLTFTLDEDTEGREEMLMVVMKTRFQQSDGFFSENKLAGELEDLLLPKQDIALLTTTTTITTITIATTATTATTTTKTIELGINVIVLC